MKDKILTTIKLWKNRLNNTFPLNGMYLFGSLIYRDGIQFDSTLSDVDIIAIIPDNLQSAISRTHWIQDLKKHKRTLEQELLFALERQDTSKEIASIVPITQLELKLDIHKSDARDFFQQNRFLNLDTGETLEPGKITRFEYFDHELLTQVLKSIQKARNTFLKNTSVKDLNFLEYSGDERLPKEISREAAKLALIIDGKNRNGDEFNTSFGFDFIKKTLSESIDTDPKFLELYTLLDSKSGGRSNTENKKILTSIDHLLLYEILYDLAAKQISTITQSDTNNELIGLIKEKGPFLKFLHNTGLLSKAHSNKDELALDDIFVFPDLERYDDIKDHERTMSAEKLISEFSNFPRIVIAGDPLSGRTTLCKKLFLELREKNLVPVYLSNKETSYAGKIENQIEKAFQDQYESNISINSIDKKISF